MKPMKNLTGLAGIFLLLGILIAFNAVVRPMRARIDVTEDKLYTLSDGTKQLLGDLDRDVTLKFYFSKSNDRLSVPTKNFAARVRDLLKEYESRSDDYLVVEEYDPKPDSDEEEWAQRYGLQGQALDMFGLSGQLYFGIVAVSGNREAAIPVLAESTEPRLEYLLTRMVSEVASEKQAQVGLMTALPMQGSSTMNPYMMQSNSGSSKWAVLSELDSQFDIETVDMTATNIAENIDTLVVVHPADISDDTLYALDQFVLRGGRLLAFTDPMCLAAADNSNPQMMQMGQMPQLESDLNALTSAWGIEMTTGQLAADESAATLLSASNGSAQRNPAWLSLRDTNINREDVATGSLNDLMLPFAGAFEGSVSNGLTQTELLFTEKDGFTVDAMSVQSGTISQPLSRKSVPVALRISGTFKTAFPNRDGGLKESSKTGVVILVSDVDMLTDRMATESMNLFGRTIVQPRNDNLSFTANMVEQLCGSEALIGLRSRNAFDRPFDRVIELEKQAAFTWQSEEERLNQKLQSTQQRLAALQQTSDDGQQMVLNPEQETEIKKFREEVFQTQQLLKEVRKNLRRDIEQLGVRLKAINIAGIPLLVALFGIGRGIWMKKTR
jgi:ABC-type uncharacterized transport system involved in gliding motility auxiliary subunit